MMNETLQRELSAHLKKIRGREGFIKNWGIKVKEKERQIGREWNNKDELIKKVHLKAKIYLDEKGFNYEKDRNNHQARIRWIDGFLKVREYKNHGFGIIRFNTNVLTEFLPDGFLKAYKIFDKKCKKIEKLKINFKCVIKLREGIKVQHIERWDNTIGTERIVEIELNNTGETYTSGIKIEISGDEHSGINENAYYHDRIFRNILKLMKKYEKNLNNVFKAQKKLQADLLCFTENQFDRIIMLEKLKEEKE